ncbi:MAG: hypothetical protein DWQ31_20915 [Planctomycetota bacterium]|nr:MAG: hypothetical protein DWQ31_20915 [Planctomycetota bacterium]
MWIRRTGGYGPDPEDSLAMTRPACHRLHCYLMLVLALSILSTSSGCFRLFRNRHLEGSLPPVPAEAKVPNEEFKTTLPPYRIEPPDVLLIDALKVVPKPPYRLELLDIVNIEVEGELPDQPIQGEYQVDPAGNVNLGLSYGLAPIAGLTVDEAEQVITAQLSKTIIGPKASVTLVQTSGTQQIAGEHLVSQDGTVNLGNYGQVYVTGMTLHEAKVAIEEHLTDYLDDPKVSVDLFGSNSKVYYVVTNGAGQGDQLQRIPIEGGETVLDAISVLGGLSPTSVERMWIARPSPDKSGADVILPVDWTAIVTDASPATNYQIMPDDRIYIDGNKLVRTDTILAQIYSPLQRVATTVTLGSSAVRSLSIGFRSVPGAADFGLGGLLPGG